MLKLLASRKPKGIVKPRLPSVEYTIQDRGKDLACAHRIGRIRKMGYSAAGKPGPPFKSTIQLSRCTTFKGLRQENQRHTFILQLPASTRPKCPTSHPRRRRMSHQMAQVEEVFLAVCFSRAVTRAHLLTKSCGVSGMCMSLLGGFYKKTICL
jgi:hypothetical protein